MKMKEGGGLARDCMRNKNSNKFGYDSGGRGSGCGNEGATARKTMRGETSGRHAASAQQRWSYWYRDAWSLRRYSRRSISSTYEAMRNKRQKNNVSDMKFTIDSLTEIEYFNRQLETIEKRIETDDEEEKLATRLQAMLTFCRTSLLVSVVSVIGFSNWSGIANATGLVDEFNASGFVFKDQITVESFEDPKVSNIALYVSGHRRSVAEKLSQADFGDTTQTSLACVPLGPVALKADVDSRGGEEIFSERKNLFTKVSLQNLKYCYHTQTTILHTRTHD